MRTRFVGRECLKGKLTAQDKDAGNAKARGMICSSTKERLRVTDRSYRVIIVVERKEVFFVMIGD